MAEMTRTEMQERALNVGLFIDTWSPGDGATRYRFFTEPVDYFAGQVGHPYGLFTALGLKEAVTFAKGWIAAKSWG